MRFFVLTICSLIFSCAWSQNAQIDSLTQYIQNNAEDTLQVKALVQLAFEYRNIDTDKTIEIAREALALSEKIKYAEGEAQATRNIGLGHYVAGRYDTARRYCEKAIIIAEQAGALGSKADALNTLGNIHYVKGEYVDAIASFEQTIDIYSELSRGIDEAGALANIATILSNQGYYAKSLDNFQRSLSIFEKMDHINGQAIVAHNIAGIYEKQDQFEKALEYYLKTSRLDSITGDKVGRATTLTNVANINVQLKNNNQAIFNYHRSLKLYKEAGAKCRLSGPMSNLGDLYLKLSLLDSAYYYISGALNIANNCDDPMSIIQASIDMAQYQITQGLLTSAERVLLKAHDLAKEIDLRPAIRETASELYHVYKQRANYQQALKYLELSRSIENEIFNEDNTRELTRIEAEYEFERERHEIEHERELEALQYDEEIERQAFIQYIVIAGLVAASILALVISRLYIMKRRNNKELAKSNNEISERNAEIQAQNEEIIQQRDQIEERSRVVEQQKLELMKKNDELVELNEEKNALIGIVAHDLKSPINQIRGLLNLTKVHKESLPDDISQYIDLMEESSERSIEMIDRILDINAIENRQLELRVEPIKVAEVLNETFQSCQVVAKEKEIRLHANYESNDAVISVDKNIFIEVIENLVSNAIKFSDSGKEIFMELEEKRNSLEIKVKDQGPGISAEEQKVLFNKYQQLSAKPTAGEKSTGLGLAIVKRYVEEMLGSVRCESQLGKGATFIIEFPKTY